MWYLTSIFFLSCNVLVSLKPLCLGLPQDTTEEEFIEMMSKYGIIMQDPETSMSDSYVFGRN